MPGHAERRALPYLPAPVDLPSWAGGCHSCPEDQRDSQWCKPFFSSHLLCVVIVQCPVSDNWTKFCLLNIYIFLLFRFCHLIGVLQGWSELDEGYWLLCLGHPRDCSCQEVIRATEWCEEWYRRLQKKLNIFDLLSENYGTEFLKQLNSCICKTLMIYLCNIFPYS